MKVLNFGSLNLDYVYRVEHFVQPGETLSAMSQKVNPGGKGLNSGRWTPPRRATPSPVTLSPG